MAESVVKKIVLVRLTPIGSIEYRHKLGCSGRKERKRTEKNGKERKRTESVLKTYSLNLILVE